MGIKAFENILENRLRCFDLIKIGFHSGCKRNVKNIVKTPHQKVVDNHSEFARFKITIHQVDVFFHANG